MEYPNAICIDFGSAYTKIAVRKGWDSQTKLLQNIPIALPDEEKFCVPTVVAQVRRATGSQWLIGYPAASQSRGENVTIFDQFKAKLFLGDDADPSTIASREAAVKFFSGLRETLQKSKFPFDLARCAVRVCIPKLNQNGHAERVMCDVLSKSSWSGSANKVIYEPESNAIGVFTRGANAVIDQATRKPDYGGMFPLTVGLLKRIRDVALNLSPHRYYGALVVDVGAFTTDFGYVRFDADLREPPVVEQFSYELGIQQLDRAVMKSLPPSVAKVIASTAPIHWERAKRLMYEGQEAELVNPQGGTIRVGGKADQHVVAMHIRQFCERIIKGEQKFRCDYVKGPVNAYLVTGGGTMIEAIRCALLNSSREPLKYDLLDENEPKFALRWRKDPYTGENYLDPKEYSSRLTDNRRLLRGASAIGGCSVLFQ